MPCYKLQQEKASAQLEQDNDGHKAQKCVIKVVEKGIAQTERHSSTARFRAVERRNASRKTRASPALSLRWWSVDGDH